MTAQQTDAAHRLLNAQRTGCQQAITSAEAYQRFQTSQAQAAAATQREANRLHAIGPRGRYDESVSGHFGPHL